MRSTENGKKNWLFAALLAVSVVLYCTQSEDPMQEVFEVTLNKTRDYVQEKYDIFIENIKNQIQVKLQQIKDRKVRGRERMNRMKAARGIVCP